MVRGISRNGDSPWLVALFLLPLFAQAFSLGWLYHSKVNKAFYEFYTLTTTICVGGYCALWLAHIQKPSQGWANFLSLIALAGIVGLVGFVVLLTFAIMKSSTSMLPERWNRFSDDLMLGLSDHPFFGMLLFFTLFLGIAYLFGFAFAFEDRYALARDPTKPALHIVNLPSIDDDANKRPSTSSSRSPEGKPEGENKNSEQRESTTPNSNEGTKTPDASKDEAVQQSSYRFYFNSKQARFETSKPERPCPPSLETEDKNFSKPGEHNYCQLSILCKYVKEMTTEGRRVRVILMGHCDKEQYANSKDPKLPDYKSNYELSEARSLNVKSQVLAGLQDTKEWHSVEWFSLPTSSESLSINPWLGKLTLDPSLEVENRVVIALVESISDHLTQHQWQLAKVRNATLMDHIYFSIYTITTTGYGDIIPTTAYAKFLCSLANILEVFFLVVFVNALLSLGPRRRRIAVSSGNKKTKDKPPAKVEHAGNGGNLTRAEESASESLSSNSEKQDKS